MSLAHELLRLRDAGFMLLVDDDRTEMRQLETCGKLSMSAEEQRDG